jgi:hypothetical protein
MDRRDVLNQHMFDQPAKTIFASHRRAVRFATPSRVAAGAGAETVNALKFQPDQSVGPISLA